MSNERKTTARVRSPRIERSPRFNFHVKFEFIRVWLPICVRLAFLPAQKMRGRADRSHTRIKQLRSSNCSRLSPLDIGAMPPKIHGEFAVSGRYAFNRPLTDSADESEVFLLRSWKSHHPSHKGLGYRLRKFKNSAAAPTIAATPKPTCSVVPFPRKSGVLGPSVASKSFTAR